MNQLAGYDVYYEREGDAGGTRLLHQTLKLLKWHLKRILLGFEAMETPFMSTVEKSMRLLNW